MVEIQKKIYKRIANLARTYGIFKNTVGREFSSITCPKICKIWECPLHGPELTKLVDAQQNKSIFR